MSEYPTPPLRVSRASSACTRCRSAKIKCDGELPACSACERAGKASECSGASDQFARGRERSYISSLESKIEKLEARLATLDRRRAMSVMSTGDTPQPTPHPTPQLSVARLASQSGDVASRRPTREERQKKRAEAGDIEELVADLGYLAINATTRDFYGFADTVSFGRIALKASAVSKALDDVPRAPLPPRNMATQFVQHYFDKIFPTLPCLNEASFFGALESIYRNDGTATPFDSFSVYMVLAVGTMSLSRTKDSPAAVSAARFVKNALVHADTVISPSEIRGVQATLLLVQYAMLEPGHFNSWYLIGVASRIMIDIGLHQEPLKISKKRGAEMDLRRRIFYCVYTLDRSISMVLQRPFTFSDDSVSVRLPRCEVPEMTEVLVRGTLTPMAAANHLFKLRQIQSCFYQYLHLCGNDVMPEEQWESYVQHHTAKLTAWKDEMPTAITKSTIDWLSLEWHYLMVYIAAPSPKIPRPSQASMEQIFRHCSAYSKAYRSILQDSGNTRFVYTYHDALRTYFIGSNLLHSLYRSEEILLPVSATVDELQSAADAVEAVVYILTTMIERWPEVDILKEKYNTEAGYFLARVETRIEQVHAVQQAVADSAGGAAFGQWGGQVGPFAMSGHVATADFGNLAFYRYS